MSIFSLVQSKSATATSGSPTLTLDNAPTPGNLLLFAAHMRLGTAPNGGDLAAAGWTVIASLLSGSGSTAVGYAMYYKIVPVGESTTITGNTASTAWAMAAVEYHTLGRSPIVISSSSQANAADTSQPAPSVTPNTPSEVLIICTSGIRATSPSFSGQTIGSATTSTGVTVREATNQSAAAANICLYDLMAGVPSGSYGGACASSGSAEVGSGGTVAFGLSLRGLQFFRTGNGMSTTLGT